MGVTAPEQIEQTEESVEEQAPARQADAKRLFRYSTFIDVGEGAEGCEHARDGLCEDVGHFHAWVRLPNPFQHEDIRKKALAAKARKIRELKDPESDAAVVLDEQLSAIDDPLFVETMIDELVAREWAEDYLAAQADVNEREEFEHIDQDREEYNRLTQTESALSEDEQSEEYKRLVAHLEAHVDAVRARLVEVQEPKKEELRSRSAEDLVALIRARRVDELSDRGFIDTYNAWIWFIGTFKVELHPTLGRPHKEMWTEMGVRDRPSAGTMFGAEPEVIDALKATFDDLQVSMQKASAGN